MNTTTVTISKSTEQNLKLIAAKLNLTVAEATAEMLERGVKDFVYRSQRNAAKWQQAKADRERLAELEAIHGSK